MTKHNYSWARVVLALGRLLNGLAPPPIGPSNVLYYTDPEASSSSPTRFFRACQFP